VKRTLTHFNAAGAAHMVEVGAKPETARVAIASGRVTMQRATAKAIAAGTLGKGDVLGVARLAGIQAAKRTADWIPLCHPLRLTGVDVDLRVERNPDVRRARSGAGGGAEIDRKPDVRRARSDAGGGAEVDRATVTVRATVRAFDRSGVEMEALTAVTAAALTVYDMCKAIDREMTIEAVQLEEKRGGKSGTYRRRTR
jgi:cyclic pyranopterin phosphate synthase